VNQYKLRMVPSVRVVCSTTSLQSAPQNENNWNTISVVMNIALVGMSGVGKSRVGALLAERLSYRFVDVDRVIEEAQGMRLPDLVDCLGDEKFLELEEAAILGLGEVKDCVIALGGSSVYSERAMAFVKRVSTVVFLDASLEEIKRCTADFAGRGVVGLRAKGLEAVFAERLPLYRRYADVTIDVTGLSDGAVAERIVAGCFVACLFCKVSESACGGGVTPKWVLLLAEIATTSLQTPKQSEPKTQSPA
jgi:shikimate kinase